MTGSVARTEVLAEGQVEALAQLLDLTTANLPGGHLPELWHWTHLLERPAQAAIGADGHPIAGTPTPPGPGFKRMFAGGRVITHALLRHGAPATRHTRVTGSVTKEGRSGPLTFVTVRHEYHQDGALAVIETNDIVYRDATSAGTPEVGTPGRHLASVPDGPLLTIDIDETFLFRFSALTYNAHRIHFDLGWAAHEGYGGLVVHGPLQALLMGELIRREGPGLVGREFAYRLHRPAVGTQRITVAAHEDGLDHGARVLDVFGNVTATARLSLVESD